MSQPMKTYTVIKVSGIKLKDGRFGVYHNRGPQPAAKKAHTELCRKYGGSKGGCAYTVTIQEITRGSKRKTFTYRTKRIKDPKTVKKGKLSITFNYRVEAKPLKTNSS